MATFDNKLVTFIDERETALFEIERTIFTGRYNLSQNHFEILSIHTITMIYSIWEGFVQQAFKTYIAELNLLDIEFNKFKEEINVFHIENEFKQLREYPTRFSKKVEYFNKLDFFFNVPKQQLNNTIKTDSNVSFEVLNKLLISLSLEPFPEFWHVYKHPNPNLRDILKTFLRYRNGVAHGGDLSSEEKVTSAVYSKYKTLVLDLMYEIYFKMSESINKQHYLKNIA